MSLTHPLLYTIHFHKVQHKDCTVHLECNFCHLVNIVLLLAHTAPGSQNMEIILFSHTFSCSVCLACPCAQCTSHTDLMLIWSLWANLFCVKTCSSSNSILSIFYLFCFVLFWGRTKTYRWLSDYREIISWNEVVFVQLTKEIAYRGKNNL